MMLSSFLPHFFGALALLLGSGHALCIARNEPTVFRDMHDGDLKVITANEFTFQIKSYNKSETWVVNGEWDVHCVASVDFNVPGKPNPPSVNLTMTMYMMASTDRSLSSLGFEFTDPSSTLAPATQPLNFWVMVWSKPRIARSDANVSGKTCSYTPPFHSLVVHDMHDGDMKSLTVKGSSLDIIPYNKKQSWSVDAKFGEDCVASVNFNVKGKPNPPPVPLNAQVWKMASIAGMQKDAVLFTDPSGTIASEHATLNAWVPSNAKHSEVSASDISYTVKWLRSNIRADDQCEPRHVFVDAKSACLACHGCRQKNECPCSYFTEDSKTFFCFDSHAPDMPQGGDFHNEGMHCDVLTKGNIQTCAENAVQTTKPDETRLYSMRSNMNDERDGSDRNFSIAAVAVSLALLSAGVCMFAVRIIRTRSVDGDSDDRQLLSVLE